jgi:predicted RNase H-like nuclease (RuvC/YqgF family)
MKSTVKSTVKKQRKKVAGLLPLLVLLLVAGLQTKIVYGAELDSVIKAGVDKTTAAQASQRRIDSTVAQSDKLLRQFQLVNKQIEGLQVYNAQLTRQIDNQHRTMAEIAESVENAALIERQIIPLSLNMLDALAQFIRLDLPFKIEERQTSVEQVRENMDSARFSAAEKSRQVLELYAIESEYSATIEQFDGVLAIEGQQRQGVFLRIGRIALLFQSADQSNTQVWNKTDKQWQAVAAGDYRRAVANAIRMAKKQAPLDMIKLPLPAPVSATASQRKAEVAS